MDRLGREIPPVPGDPRRVRLLRRTLMIFSLGAIGLATVILTTSRPPSLTEVTLAVADLPVFSLVHVAEGKDLFARYGLKVRTRHFKVGRDALVAVINGEAELATVFDTPFVLQVLNGHDLGILSSLHTSRRNTALVARGDRGIRLPRDLKGKRIGFCPGTSSEYFLYLFLETNGIDQRDVSLVKTEPDKLIPLLESGADAIVTWEPSLYEIKSKYPRGVDPVFMYSDVYREFSVLAGKRPFLQERTDIGVSMLKALMEADELIKNHPDEAFEVVLPRLPHAAPDALRAAWTQMQFTLDLTSVLMLALTQQSELFSKELNIRGAAPDFHRMMILDPLTRLKPDAVTVVHQVRR